MLQQPMRWCFVVFVHGLAGMALWAQSTSTGEIAGTIRDAGGGVIPGVGVSAVHLATNQVREGITDESGVYRLPQLPVGEYEISAELEGFKSVRRQGVIVNVGQTSVVDLVLGIGDISEVVTVTGDAPMVDTTTHQTQTVINSAAIEHLPLNGRNFQDLVLLVPGAAPDGRGTVSFGGVRGIYNSLSIDGADNNSAFFAGNLGGERPPYQYSQEAVQEFQVVMNGFNAEYGRAGGGIVNIVTKSGSNDLRGSLFYFLRDDKLSANNFFTNANPNVREDDFRRQQFGGSVGGPLRRDRAFYFLSYDQQLGGEPRVINMRRPALGVDYTEADLAAAPNAAVREIAQKYIDGAFNQSYNEGDNVNVFLAKVDWQAGPEDVSRSATISSITGRKTEPPVPSLPPPPWKTTASRKTSPIRWWDSGIGSSPPL